MTLSDLDTRYHDMLRELRRWGITESDGRGQIPSAKCVATGASPTTTCCAAELELGSSPSDTTEQKKAA